MRGRELRRPGPGPCSRGGFRIGTTHYDRPALACLWVGSILAFLKAVEPDGRASANPRWGWVVTFGLLAGAAAATKLTGWFLPLPFLAWALIYRDRAAPGGALAAAGVVAALSGLCAHPALVGRPRSGGSRGFLGSNLTRGRTTYIPTQFLGQVYLTPQGSLPWYNTLVWTGALWSQPVRISSPWRSAG